MSILLRLPNLPVIRYTLGSLLAATAALLQWAVYP
jgi:hypothetical protein